jgi:hypothetical protein
VPAMPTINTKGRMRVTVFAEDFDADGRRFG